MSACMGIKENGQQIILATTEHHLYDFKSSIAFKSYVAT